MFSTRRVHLHVDISAGVVVFFRVLKNFHLETFLKLGLSPHCKWKGFLSIKSLQTFRQWKLAEKFFLLFCIQFMFVFVENGANYLCSQLTPPDNQRVKAVENLSHILCCKT